MRQIDWDNPIPADLLRQWTEYCSELPNLGTVRISRWTGTSREQMGFELHGFADASTRAYAAVVYLRVLHSMTNIQISLIAAKTKVAPLKTVSVPRLELNAVVLLSRLMDWTRNALNLERIPLYGWIDSTIALAWIRQHPAKWNCYVANRVSEVQTRLPAMRWNHVRSRDNPSDCASRGMSASELTAHDLWWSGPSWLRKPSASWPIQEDAPPLQDKIRETMLSEARKIIVHHVDTVAEWDLPTKYSSWTKLLRITAYLRRFIQNVKNKVASLQVDTSNLKPEELSEASAFWFRSVQSSHLHSEWKALNAQAALPRSSQLRSLNPFIGKDQLIRLGGRLENCIMLQ